MMTADVAQQTIEQFHARIADPDQFSGGGSVAAVAAAGAGATALLVMQLNVRRKSNQSNRQEIETAIATTEALIADFHAEAAADISILNELLDAQREARESGNRARYLAALERAAESPLAMAESVARLLETIESQMGIATRFTVSDLGAAAALAEGACRAALLTAEVNIALLREDAEADRAIAARLESQRANVRARVVERAGSIEASTREAMLRPRTAKEKS